MTYTERREALVRKARCKIIAQMLIDHGAENSTFMEYVEDELNKLGYTLACHQLGIHGTHLIICKKP